MKKAILLAAGLGTRLRPVTNATPKCLIPIQGRPLLNIWLDICDRLGLEEILINTHHLHEQVREWAHRQTSRVRITLFHEPSLLGSAGTVAANRAFVEDEDFFIFYADNLVRANLEALKAFHSRHSDALTIALFHAPKPENCGILSVDEAGRVRRFEEKPLRPESDLANAGIYIARSELFDLLPPTPAMDFGKDVLPNLIGHAWACPLEGFIMDVGTPENYRLAQTVPLGIGGSAVVSRRIEPWAAL